MFCNMVFAVNRQIGLCLCGDSYFRSDDVGQHLASIEVHSLVLAPGDFGHSESGDFGQL